MDKEHQQDMEIAHRVMKDNREALHELATAESPSVGSNGPPEQSRLISGPNGVRVFPARDGRVINLEMIEKAQEEMGIEDVRTDGTIIRDDTAEPMNHAAFGAWAGELAGTSSDADPEFEEDMRIAREVMREDRDALRKLGDS